MLRTSDFYVTPSGAVSILCGFAKFSPEEQDKFFREKNLDLKERAQVMGMVKLAAGENFSQGDTAE